MSIKKQVEYTDDLSVGDVTIKLNEAGKWSFDMVSDGLSKKDLAIMRNLLVTLIEEQELAR